MYTGSLLISLSLLTATPAAAAGTATMPEAVCYTVTPLDTGVIRYDFKMTSIDAGTTGWMILGDSGSWSSADSQKLADPVFVSSDAPYSSLATTTGGHNGPTYAPVTSLFTFPGGANTTYTFSLTSSTAVDPSHPFWFGRTLGTLPMGPNQAALMRLDDPAADLDGDGLSDACDPDGDGDGKSAFYDCDDRNAAIEPGAVEACDNIDSNCDGSLIDGFTNTDGDALPDCVDDDDDADGTPDGQDCAPTDPNSHPGAIEIPDDGIDNDCDGRIDETGDADGDGISDEVEIGLGLDPNSSDSDGDGVPDGTEIGADVSNPLDTDGDGLIDALDVDDDSDGLATIDEIGDWDGVTGPAPDGDSDGIPDYLDTDSNGNGVPDSVEGLGDLDGDGIPNSSDIDADGDGYNNDVDCNDADPAIHPGAGEVLDGVDNDCNGTVDDVPAVDTDGDGFGAGVDCDDTDASISPDAAEVCDGVDNNCDGKIDEGLDEDGDGATSCNGDCDDTDAATNPNAVEICDGIDNDCNGSIDDNCIGGPDTSDGRLDDQGGCGCDTGTSGLGVAWVALLGLIALRRRSAR